MEISDDYSAIFRKSIDKRLEMCYNTLYTRE